MCIAGAAYKAGGDAFDYSLLGDHLHVSIFDALGHDLAAGLMASVGIASCRSTRRAGGSLAAITARADHAIATQFGESRFVTALLCDLDLVPACSAGFPAATRRLCSSVGTGPSKNWTARTSRPWAWSA